MSENPLDKVQQGANILGEVLRTAGENPNVREAGSELGKSVLTVAKAVNHCLLPLAAINYAFDKARDYFGSRFQSDMERKTQSIPAGDLIEPKASIAGPALQALAFAHEEETLREMYLSLITSAMSRQRAGTAHPAFVEIIRQLTAEEAGLLSTLLADGGNWPLVRLHSVANDASYTLVNRGLIQIVHVRTEEPLANPRIPAMLDNWHRLGLVDIHFEASLKQQGAYDWVESRPEFLEARDKAKLANRKVKIVKGILRVTDLGLTFAEAIDAPGLAEQITASEQGTSTKVEAQGDD